LDLPTDRHDTEVAPDKKENGVIPPARFPQVLGELQCGQRMFVLDSGGKHFDGSRWRLIRRVFARGGDTRLCLGERRRNEPRRQQQCAEKHHRPKARG
jgi:hypothetical protein